MMMRIFVCVSFLVKQSLLRSFVSNFECVNKEKALKIRTKHDFSYLVCSPQISLRPCCTHTMIISHLLNDKKKPNKNSHPIENIYIQIMLMCYFSKYFVRKHFCSAFKYHVRFESYRNLISRQKRTVSWC